MERSCKVKENDGEWPSMNDDSGDSMFLVDGNSLIQEIRTSPRDLFLENFRNFFLENCIFGHYMF